MALKNLNQNCGIVSIFSTRIGTRADLCTETAGLIIIVRLMHKKPKRSERVTCAICADRCGGSSTLSVFFFCQRPCDKQKVAWQRSAD